MEFFVHISNQLSEYKNCCVVQRERGFLKALKKNCVIDS